MNNVLFFALGVVVGLVMLGEAVEPSLKELADIKSANESCITAIPEDKP